MPRRTLKKAYQKSSSVNDALTEKLEEATPTISKKHTVEEIRQFALEQQKLEDERLIKKFATAKAAASGIGLTDLSKSENRTYTVFNKEKLRQYIKSPFANQANLRNLSRFLYRVSQNYRRIITYNAEMLDLNSRSVIPLIDITKSNNANKVLKNYYSTLIQLDKMNMQKEILKCAIIAWREDTFYGITFEDDTGFFILPLDGEYCKVSSSNYDGTLNFAFDLSYFRSRDYLLEYYGEPFISMYRSYQGDTTNMRWQEIPVERGVCFKVNMDDLTMDLPPFVGLFEELIDLVDLRSIQSVKDELSIYKLIVSKIDTLSGTNEPDDFAVDLDTAIEFYNRMTESLPDGIASVLSPMDIEAVTFKDDQTEDVNRIEEATKNLFNNSGGAQILNSSSISGTTAFTAAVLADSTHALRALLPQIEAWVNRYLTCVLGEHAKVRYLAVSPLTKDAFRKRLLEDATYGEPNRLMLNTLNGISELETLSLKFLEQDCLNLHEEMIPLQSSHTQSGDGTKESGGQTKDDTDLSDSGEASRDKETN